MFSFNKKQGADNMRQSTIKLAKIASGGDVSTYRQQQLPAVTDDSWTPLFAVGDATKRAVGTVLAIANPVRVDAYMKSKLDTVPQSGYLRLQAGIYKHAPGQRQVNFLSFNCHHHTTSFQTLDQSALNLLQVAEKGSRVDIKLSDRNFSMKDLTDSLALLDELYPDGSNLLALACHVVADGETKDWSETYGGNAVSGKSAVLYVSYVEVYLLPVVWTEGLKATFSRTTIGDVAKAYQAKHGATQKGADVSNVTLPGTPVTDPKTIKLSKLGLS